MRTDALLGSALEQVLGVMTPENRLVLEVQLATGLRVSDVLCLRTEQLSRDDGRITVIEQKTGKTKQIRLSAPLLKRIRAQAGKYWAFPAGKNGDPAKHRSRQAVYFDVKRAAKAYRLIGCFGTHSARKAFAVRLMDKYGDIDKVRRALNHSSLNTTILYACADKLAGKPSSRKRKNKGKPKPGA